MLSNIWTKAGLLATFAINAAIAASSVPTISAVGSKFFYSNGTQYYIKGMHTTPCLKPLKNVADAPITGIAYQLTDADPLIDTEQCQLDAALMSQLGANAIRVYHVDPTGSHSGCMSAFADAGIYLFVDLDTFNTAIDPVCYPLLSFLCREVH